MIAADIGFWDIVIYVIAGAIIGALGRLLVPGRQTMGWVVTVVLGIAAAVIGGFLWNAVFSGNEGVAWIGSVIVAVVLVYLYVKFFGSRSTA
ncbi:MAG TPA: GlsB/YeaQ/YmgE family stress response membrane protein [Actinomycetota bacterium]|nr:GlsB/YeaQ/YmgE family stress response membrane protein [Actinomycetota bacterium]